MTLRSNLELEQHFGNFKELLWTKKCIFWNWVKTENVQKWWFFHSKQHLLLLFYHMGLEFHVMGILSFDSVSKNCFFIPNNIYYFDFIIEALDSKLWAFSVLTQSQKIHFFIPNNLYYDHFVIVALDSKLWAFSVLTQSQKTDFFYQCRKQKFSTYYVENRNFLHSM